MTTLTLKKPSQKAQETLSKIIRAKRIEQAEYFIKSFTLFKDEIPLPAKLSIHKDLNKIRKKEKYEFGAQHIRYVLHGIFTEKAYQKQIYPGVQRYGLDRKPV